MAIRGDVEATFLNSNSLKIITSLFVKNLAQLKSLHFILAQCGNSIITTACPLKSS